MNNLLKKLFLIALACLCLVACSNSGSSTHSNITVSSTDLLSTSASERKESDISHCEQTPIVSYVGENRYVERIDVKKEIIGTCAYIILGDIDWNSLEFSQRGEIAVQALDYTFDILENNHISIISASGVLENGDMLFSITDGTENIIIWEVGQEDYSYDNNDIYIWERKSANPSSNSLSPANSKSLNPK